MRILLRLRQIQSTFRFDAIAENRSGALGSPHVNHESHSLNALGPRQAKAPHARWLVVAVQNSRLLHQKSRTIKSVR